MAVNFWKGGEKGKAECPLQGEKKTFNKGTFKNHYQNVSHQIKIRILENLYLQLCNLDVRNEHWDLWI